VPVHDNLIDIFSIYCNLILYVGLKFAELTRIFSIKEHSNVYILNLNRIYFHYTFSLGSNNRFIFSTLVRTNVRYSVLLI